MHAQTYVLQQGSVNRFEGHSNALCRSIARKMPDKGSSKFIRLRVKCKEVEGFLSEEYLHGVVVHNTFSSDPDSGCSVPEEGLPPHDNI